jgi:hypothetical protein
VLIYRRKHKYIKQKNTEVPLDDFKGAVIEEIADDLSACLSFFKTKHDRTTL